MLHPAERNITDKGGKVVSRSLLSLHGDAGANDPVFVSLKVEGLASAP